MRPATKVEIVQAVQKLAALRKPKDVPSVMIEAYEIALDGVSAVALEVATQKLLRNAKFMPSPSELYQEVNDLEPNSRTHQPEPEVLTPGQRMGQPLLKDDPEARARANALWEKVRPTLKGLKSFDDAGRDMAELKRQHEGAALDKAIAEAKKRDQANNPSEPMTEAERLERIKQRGHEPTQPTQALLRSLANPMNPDRG